MTELDIRLAAFADGELDAEATREVEALIAADPALRHIVEIHQETAARLRVACAESFYANGTLQLLGNWPRRRRATVVRWAAVAALVAGIVGFGAGMSANRLMITPRDRMLDEVAEYHAVYSHETVHLVEVAADQSDNIKTWLGRRVDDKLEIPDLQSAGLHFAGGRLLVINGKPMAELVYTREGGMPVALCISRRSDTMANRPVELDKRGGQMLASWAHDGHAYVVVGDLDATDAQKLADQVIDRGAV